MTPIPRWRESISFDQIRIWMQEKSHNSLPNVSKDTVPIFLISQIQRSGGTLVSQLFDNHPEIAAHPHELYIGHPRKWFWPSVDVKNMSCRKAFSILYEKPLDSFILRGYRKHPRGEGSVYPFKMSKRKLFKAFEDICEASWPLNNREIIDSYLSAYFVAWEDGPDLAGKKFISAFVPRLNMYEESVADYWRDFPDGAFLTIVREPKNWLQSSMKHNRRHHRDPRSALHDWRQSVERSLQIVMTRNHNAKLITFESLVADTRYILENLCEWLDVTWNDTLLEPTFLGQPMASNSSFRSPTEGAINKRTIQRTSGWPSGVSFNERNELTALYDQAKELETAAFNLERPCN